MTSCNRQRGCLHGLSPLGQYVRSSVQCFVALLSALEGHKPIRCEAYANVFRKILPSIIACTKHGAGGSLNFANAVVSDIAYQLSMIKDIGIAFKSNLHTGDSAAIR